MKNATDEDKKRIEEANKDNDHIDSKAGKVIKKQVKKYRELIEDFKKTYPQAQLTNGDIDDYVDVYEKELEVFSNLDETLLREILKKVAADLELIVESKRKLGFSRTSSKFLQRLLKHEFINRPPSEFTGKIEIADSVYKEDPWGQHNPLNDKELKIHEKWWDIELWKHDAIKDYFFKNQGNKAETKSANNGKTLSGVAEENTIRFKERFKKEWPKLETAILKTLDGKSLDEFETPQGNVGLSFCEKVHRKYEGVPPRTLYKWFNRESVQKKIMNAIQEDRSTKNLP